MEMKGKFPVSYRLRPRPEERRIDPEVKSGRNDAPGYTVLILTDNKNKPLVLSASGPFG